ncbi:hypothetical protein M1L60_13275 [Actinoplanes sp. TRM 88003]|uniref:STAS domain-containing protein n=1 Tax=Paractinoplanes aksuensis TaxID=2939490 RepID=A0ABT1DL59_9ACTN|nr:hypothetical protein [Actinoplanes aksuensis]MCO8271565.1 hypothetical protein [Actinoplanes aksuensis]
MIEQRPAVQSGISVDSVEDGAIIVLAVHGRWSVTLRIETFNVLRRCLTAHPAGLLIDLTGLDDPEALSLPAGAKAAPCAAGREVPA